MFELDAEKMLEFYVKDDDEVDASGLSTAGIRMTKESGIINILPGSIIDYFVFEPAGYSMNGLFGEYYWTIHITPQKKCSYVSFEKKCKTELSSQLLQLYPLFYFSNFATSKKKTIPPSITIPILSSSKLSMSASWSLPKAISPK